MQPCPSLPNQQASVSTLQHIHSLPALAHHSVLDASRALQVSKFPLSYMFAMCALFLGVCAVCQRRLEGLVGGAGISTKDYEAVKVQGVADGPL